MNRLSNTLLALFLSGAFASSGSTQEQPPAQRPQGINRPALAPLPFGKTIAPPDLSTSTFLDVSGSPSVSPLLPNVKITTRKDVIFSRVKAIGGRPMEMKLDLFIPEEAKNLPLVVFITGGGFMFAPKASNPEGRSYVARSGYVVASVEYRVVPDGLYSDAVADVKSAIRYLRAHATEFGIDSSKVAVWGESAGGYLTAMVGLSNGVASFEVGDNLDQSSSVQAGIDVFGLSDLTRIAMDYDEEAQKGHRVPNISEAIYVLGPGNKKPIQDEPKAAERANPVTYVDKNDPPFLFMHGSHDVLVSPSQTLLVHNALRAAAVPTSRYLIKDAGHGGPAWQTKAAMDIVVDFLDKNLKRK